MRIIVDDPTGKYGEGTRINPEFKGKLDLAGITSLPLDPVLLKDSGVGGYVVRRFGNGGEAIPSVTGFFARTTLFVKREFPLIHFSAAIQIEKGSTGHFRFVQDGTQAHTTKGGLAGLNAFDLTVLQNKMAQENESSSVVIVEGHASLNLTNDAYAGFALYGSSSHNAKCLWIAVSNTSK